MAICARGFECIGIEKLARTRDCKKVYLAKPRGLKNPTKYKEGLPMGKRLFQSLGFRNFPKFCRPQG